MKNRKPEWMKKVDSDMKRYITCEYTIWHHEELIKNLLATGTKTIASYIPREGSPGGERSTKEENYLLRIEQSEEVIQKCKSYRKHLEKAIEALYGHNPDKMTFIRCYWWKSLNYREYNRKNLVLKALPYLRRINRLTMRRGSKANNTYYGWRKEIYKSIADLFGYREMEDIGGA
ncbi:MAG: hypothetical protein ACOX8T_12625 [Bacillota bacterium]